MRLIDADALKKRMYHDAFETDSDMQKWDGGCWIRFKMFENAIEDAPTVEPIKVGDVCKECWRDGGNVVEVVRCKDCKWYKTNYSWNGTEHKVCVRESYEPTRKAIDYCSHGERKSE